MKLNRTGSNWNRLERNKINENWDIIEGSYNDVVGQITDEVVGHLIDSARLDWKEPVDTVEDLPTNAEVGETRMVREADPDGISYVYRYDGENWEKIQAIDVTLVNEVDRRLTRQLAHIAINVNSFPYVHPEITDDLRIQRAINYARENGHKNVLVPPGDYELASMVTIKEGITFSSYGAEFNNQDNSIKFFRMESKSKLLGATINGKGHDVLEYNNVGIVIEGSSSSEYVEDITILDLEINGIAGHGIWGKFAKDVLIENFKMKHLGYSGILGLSALDWTVKNGLIHDISSLTDNTYGIIFTMMKPHIDLETNPRSKNCLVDNVIVDEHPNWEAFDTHSGEEIRFINCTSRNSKHGFAFVAGNELAPKNCSVEGSLVIGNGTGYGIGFFGSSTGAGLHNVNDFADNCRAEGNTLINCGLVGDNKTGAIAFANTRALVINGNVVNRSCEVGIHIGSNNVGFSVTSNPIIDPFGNTSAISVNCIRVDSDYNNGVIDGNSFISYDSSYATYVSEYGIYIIPTHQNNNILLGSNQSNAKIYASGIRDYNSNLLEFGENRRIYSGVGNPNGRVVASQGSIYININGGIGTTFYVKEQHTSANGWSPIGGSHSGNTSNRPTNVQQGYMYYDTQIGMPIWWNGSVWKDASNNTV